MEKYKTIKFKAVWSIELEKTIDARTEQEAEDIIKKLDFQHDGSYKEDSFEIISIETQ